MGDATRKGALVLAAVAESATGVALLVVPALVVRWLFGEEPSGVAIPMARVTGISLLGLGVACWPGPPRLGLLIYSAAVALYLTQLGIAGSGGGALLWPAVAAHASLTLLLARASIRGGGVP